MRPDAPAASRPSARTRALLALAVGLVAALAAATEPTDWPQWGGAGRDFRVADPGLARDWSTTRPEILWSRPGGEGYSGIAAVGHRLFTLVSRPDPQVAREEVVCLDATDGSEIWSYRYDVPRPEGMRLGFGPGPHATPLVASGRVFAVGTTARLVALDAASGRLLWQRDLWGELGGSRLRRGYGASPIAWKDSVILPVGGAGRGVVAFAQRDGAILWQRHDLESAQSSPILIEPASGPQMVLFVKDEVVAFDPDDGTLLWRHPHKILGPYNISTPVYGDDDLLFLSSSYGGGSRVLKIGSSAEEPAVAELWHGKRVGIQFTNAIRIDDHVYGATGRSSVMAAAIDVATGELAWKDRAIGRANYLQVGELALVLEGDGRLLLARLSPERLSILAETQLLESQTWTAPTLVGSTLYVRDRERILAVRLPRSADAPRGESLPARPGQGPDSATDST